MIGSPLTYNQKTSFFYQPNDLLYFIDIFSFPQLEEADWWLIMSSLQPCSTCVNLARSPQSIGLKGRYLRSIFWSLFARNYIPSPGSDLAPRHWQSAVVLKPTQQDEKLRRSKKYSPISCISSTNTNPQFSCTISNPVCGSKIASIYDALYAGVARIFPPSNSSRNTKNFATRKPVMYLCHEKCTSPHFATHHRYVRRQGFVL